MATAELTSARNRILLAASSEFARHGIRAVGVDTIVEKAKVAKGTFYRCFRSKDDLVSSYLKSRGDKWFDELRVGIDSRSPNPKGRPLALFDQLEESFRMDDFRGCPFIGAMYEFSDHAHPSYVRSEDHYARLESYVATLLTGAEFEDVSELSHQLIILATGAIMTAFRERKPGAAAALKPIVSVLLNRPEGGGMT